MAYGISNMEYRMWSVECGMESVRDYCSKLGRCIFDPQVVGDIWDADRIEGRALARPEDSSIYIYTVDIEGPGPDRVGSCLGGNQGGGWEGWGQEPGAGPQPCIYIY